MTKYVINERRGSRNEMGVKIEIVAIGLLIGMAAGLYVALVAIL